MSYIFLVNTSFSLLKDKYFMEIKKQNSFTYYFKETYLKKSDSKEIKRKGCINVFKNLKI